MKSAYLPLPSIVVSAIPDISQGFLNRNLELLQMNGEQM
jgi:hypothetical protein